MKTIKNILFGAILLSFGLTGISQGTGEIKGVIWDYEENAPLPYATAKVSYAGNTIGDLSDFDGRFTIKPLQPGTYLLEVSFAAKNPFTKKIIVKSGQIAFRDTVFLSANELPIFIVDGGEMKIDHYKVNNPSMRSEDMKGMAVLRNSGDLVSVIGEGSFSFNESTGEVYFRGSRSNGITTYLDGMKIPGSIPSYPAAAIKSYSVFTGGLPAKYGDTSGGVIEIETKNFFDLYNQKIAEMGITYE